MLRVEPLRNPAIVSALAEAVQRHRYDQLYVVLCRFSNLPGPRPNEALGWSIAGALLAEGARADAVVTELCSVDAQRAPAGNAAEFLPIVGAFTLARRFLAVYRAKETLAQLRLLAEDTRHLVRQGVASALLEMGRDPQCNLTEVLAAWTDGYLSASVALDVLGTRSWLDGAKSAEGIIARIDEAFFLGEGASRSDQRSQGYRTLIKALADVPAKILDRFPDATLAWLESKALTGNVELRESLSEILRRARTRGHSPGSLAGFEGQLDRAAPPRRDPKTYVGPTRQRGAKRR